MVLLKSTRCLHQRTHALLLPVKASLQLILQPEVRILKGTAALLELHFLWLGEAFVHLVLIALDHTELAPELGIVAVLAL